MRRSRTVTLTLLAASAVALQACGDDVDSTDFFVTDTASCVARYGAQAEAECNAALSQAQREHLATAPRFATVEQCREETGGECEVTPARAADKGLLSGGGTSVAMPVLAGMMIGRIMASGAGRVAMPVYAGRPPAECAPGATPAPGAACGSRSSSGSSSRFYYTRSGYAGQTDSAAARGQSVRFNPSRDMAAGVTAGTGPALGRSGTPYIARGGFGASARSYSSSGS